MTRTCLVCGDAKPLSEFLARGKGRERICEMCRDFATPEQWKLARVQTHAAYYRKRS